MPDVPPPMSPDEVTRQLAAHPGWSGDPQLIEKTYTIEYHTGIRMIVDVAKAAKEMGHHPDIDRRWDTLRFSITTHDAGHHVTILDFQLAKRIDDIAAAYGAA